MRTTIVASALVLPLAGHASFSCAQTTAGSGTTVVFPVAAQTASFASEMTLFNPGPSLLSASVKFFEANNSGAPGPKVCNDVSVPAGRSVQITLATQCALSGSGGHFGAVVVADKAVPQVNAFYGYTRVQNPQGIGFSIEGFPATNFNNQVGNATGLQRKAAAPTYQTNCFVGSLDQPVSYQLKLFNDSTGAQVGGTLSGSLAAFQQFRYLDVFGANGVNAPAGDLSNIRAEFTPTSGGSANLIGFCTVQDNTNFGADFRIAKSYGSPSSSFFAQGGNAFGTTAHLGTNDNQPLELYANGQRVMRFESKAATANVIAGSPANVASTAFSGQTIAGGGGDGDPCNSVTGATIPCRNETASALATVSGGAANLASGQGSVVAGGISNVAGGFEATVAGGIYQQASGNFSTVAGGFNNVASGTTSMVAGGESNIASAYHTFAAGNHVLADIPGCVVFGFFSSGPANCKGIGNIIRVMGDHGFTVDWGPATGNGGGAYWVEINDITPGRPINVYNGAFLSAGGAWTNASDRNRKEHFAPVDARAILEHLVTLPVTRWNYKAEPGVPRIGPVAQDFHAAFSLGMDDLTISPIDEAGVAFAAIQGLHQVIEENDAKIKALEHRVADLESMADEVAQLRAAVAVLTHGAPLLEATLHRAPRAASH